MIEAAADLTNWGQAIWWHWFAVFLRVGAVTSLLPAFGEQSVPIRIKLGLAIALSLIVAPALPNLGGHFNGLLGGFKLTITEISIGLLLGLGLRLIVIALQIAGSIAAQATSLSQLLGSAGVEPLPAIGHLLTIAGLALAVTMELHVRAAMFLIGSYEVFAPNSALDPTQVVKWGLGQIARSFSLAFQLAAPFVIASVLYNLTLGVINRAMPQLMVAFVGAPVITAGGLLLVFLSAPLMLVVWIGVLHGFLEGPTSLRP